MGGSGCGKSTFLRSINRMNDTIPNCRVTGRIEIDGMDANDKSVDPVLLRAQAGMVPAQQGPEADDVARGQADLGLVVKVELAARDGAAQVSAAGSDIAHRVSQCFDFHGPSLAVDAACTSSPPPLHPGELRRPGRYRPHGR